MYIHGADGACFRLRSGSTVGGSPGGSARGVARPTGEHTPRTKAEDDNLVKKSSPHGVAPLTAYDFGNV